MTKEAQEEEGEGRETSVLSMLWHRLAVRGVRDWISDRRSRGEAGGWEGSQQQEGAGAPGGLVGWAGEVGWVGRAGKEGWVKNRESGEGRDREEKKRGVSRAWQ